MKKIKRKAASQRLDEIVDLVIAEFRQNKKLNGTVNDSIINTGQKSAWVDSSNGEKVTFELILSATFLSASFSNC